ncbi:MAG TPA: Holliday junction resolvase RuvX [Thermoanaerobaculaceae bacterium]|nr:Holliday junction resolvase RuvX [Thermoanaerobaculaceae bacterium]
MRWLALDVGSRRVGVATCDPEGRVATALRPIPFAGAERLALEVARLVATWDAGGVVVGLPATRAGRGRGERRVAEVVAALRVQLAVVVATEDERGTTAAAEAELAAAGVPRRRWPELVDGVAARLILEQHLAALAAPPRAGGGAAAD